jgi:hypothetical protein
VKILPVAYFEFASGLLRPELIRPGERTAKADPKSERGGTANFYSLRRDNGMGRNDSQDTARSETAYSGLRLNVSTLRSSCQSSTS